MDLSTIFQFIPYAARLAAAAQTIERLEKDPGVQDILKLVEELGPLLAKAAAPAQHG
jgi:hypothetical protein